MGEEPRPRASSWQIAGVWISAAALLIAAVRAVVDVWLLLGPNSVEPGSRLVLEARQQHSTKGLKGMRLTARIKEAPDGQLTLRVDELPSLVVHARSVMDIPDAVGNAAARLTGRQKEDFEVELHF